MCDKDVNTHPSTIKFGPECYKTRGAYKFKIYWKKQNHLLHRPPKLQNAINGIQSMEIFIVQKE